jgi:hypothetical protein
MTTSQRVISDTELDLAIPVYVDEGYLDESPDVLQGVPVESIQSPAPLSGDVAPNGEVLAPYLPRQTSADASERWQGIQAGFVDDPRQAVAEAQALVGELTERIAAAFAAERSALERRWSSGTPVSTEDLRICLQRYRAFFSRLLPAVEDSNAPRH